MYCIVGNNITAKTLFLLLKQAKIDVILLQKQYSKAETDLHLQKFQTRTMAITYPNAEVLSQISDINSILENSGKINEIHVFNEKKSTFPEILLRASEFDCQAFGYIVNYLALHEVFDKEIAIFSECVFNPKQISKNDNQFSIIQDNGDIFNVQNLILTDTTCDNIIDFATELNDNFRIYDYKECGMTMNIKHALKHRGVAIEKFTNSGPLASLPCFDSNKSNIVRTIPSQMAKDLDKMNESDKREFVSQYVLPPLEEYFGDIEIISNIATFPLFCGINSQPRLNNIMFFGRRNFVMHPIAGQGFNLILRDMQRIVNFANKNNDLEKFKSDMKSRKIDIFQMLLTTHNLNQVFKIDNPIFTNIRKFGMQMINNNTLAKKSLVRNATK